MNAFARMVSDFANLFYTSQLNRMVLRRPISWGGSTPGPSEWSGDAFLAEAHQRADRGGAAWPMLGAAMDQNGETRKVLLAVVDFTDS